MKLQSMKCTQIYDFRTVASISFTYATRMIITHQAIDCSVKVKHLNVAANSNSLQCRILYCNYVKLN